MKSDLLARQLAILEERGLVRLSGEGPDLTVSFKHTLIREASYDSILHTRRAELHLRVARVIESLYPERDPVLSLTLAGHWLQAGQYSRLIKELRPRAAQLVSTGRTQALIDLLERIPPGQGPMEQVDVSLMLGEACEAAGQYERAHQVYKSALDLVDDNATCARLFYHLGTIEMRLSHFERAIDYHQQSLSLAVQLRDLPQQAEAQRGLGIAYWNLSDYANAEQAFNRSRDLCARTGDKLGLALAELDLANVYRDRGEYSRAIDAGQEARSLFEAGGFEVETAYADQVLGGCYYSAGNLEAAATCYERSTAMSRELGDPLGAATGLCNLAELYTDLGRLDRAGEDYAEAIRISRKLHNDYLLAFALTGLADLQLRRLERGGDPALQEAARKNGEESLAVAVRANSKERSGAAHRVLAQLYLFYGDTPRAREHARHAVELLRQVGHALELKRAEEIYDAVKEEPERAASQKGGGQ